MVVFEDIINIKNIELDHLYSLLSNISIYSNFCNFINRVRIIDVFDNATFAEVFISFFFSSVISMSYKCKIEFIKNSSIIIHGFPSKDFKSIGGSWSFINNSEKDEIIAKYKLEFEMNSIIKQKLSELYIRSKGIFVRDELLGHLHSGYRG